MNMLEAEKRLVEYATKNMVAIQRSMEMASKIALPITAMTGMYEAMEKAAKMHANTTKQFDGALRRIAETSIKPYLEFTQRLDSSISKTVLDASRYFEDISKLQPVQEAFRAIQAIQDIKIPEDILREHARTFDRAIQLAEMAAETLRRNSQQSDTIRTVTDTITEIAAELTNEDDATQLNLVLNNCIINIQHIAPKRWVEYAISFLLSILAGLFLVAFEKGCDSYLIQENPKIQLTPHQKTLPQGWVKTTLDSVRIDRKSSVSPAKEPEKQFELYSIPSYEYGKPEIVLGKEIGSSKISVEPDTVLLGKINPRINRVWIVGDHTNSQKIASTEWIPFFPVDGIEPHYLSHFLSTQSVRDFLAQNVSGVGGSLMRIKPVTLSGYHFPLPPLPEQHRIVAKIEELFSDLDAGIASLKKAKEQLKTYRQSVLKWAFEGKLTEDWRKQNKPEPASELLKRIKEEREKKYKEECEKTKKDGKRPPKKMKDLSPISNEELAELPVLPEGWEWVRLGTLSNIKLGKMLSDKARDSSLEHLPYLRNQNIRWGTIDFTDLKLMGFKNEEVERYSVQNGDLIVCEGGEPGRCAVYNRIEPIMYQKALHRVRTNCHLNVHVLQKCMQYLIMGKVSVKEFSQTTIKHLPLQEIIIMPIPFMQIHEQLEMLNQIESRLSEADNLENSIDESLAKSESLRQSILKQAFSGKLVPQYPKDEPAEKLIERIQKESKASNAIGTVRAKRKVRK